MHYDRVYEQRFIDNLIGVTKNKMENINYKEHSISFSPIYEKFEVEIDGKFRRFPSIASAKREIKKALDSKPFETFKVLMIRDYKVVPVTVTGTEKLKGYSRGRRESYFNIELPNGNKERIYYKNDVYSIEDLEKVTKLAKESEDLEREENNIIDKKYKVNESLEELESSVLKTIAEE